MLAGMWYSPAVLSGNQFVSRPRPQCNFWIHPWNGKIRAEVSCPPKHMPSPTPMCLCPLTTGMIRPVSSPQFDKCCFSGILTYVMGCLSAEPGKAWNSIFNIPGLEKIEFWTRGLQKLASFFCVIKNQKKNPHDLGIFHFSNCKC